MCLLALAWKIDERWPLVLAANRDERHDRPSVTAHRWHDAPQVLGGKDLEHGGTWLGVSEDGRLASVTNVRAPLDLGGAKQSRGLLARRFLTGELDLQGLRSLDLEAFNPCNFIGVQGGEAFFLTNRPEPHVWILEPGLYGLSNGALDEPWPKTVKLKAALQAWLQDATPKQETLFDALQDEDTTAGQDVHERILASAFIRGEVYGTRCSTVIHVGSGGQGELIERSFGPDGQSDGEEALSFHWPARTPLP